MRPLVWFHIQIAGARETNFSYGVVFYESGGTAQSDGLAG